MVAPSSLGVPSLLEEVLLEEKVPGPGMSEISAMVAPSTAPHPVELSPVERLNRL